jgi:hypothetical protein
LKKDEKGLLLVKWNTAVAKPQLWGLVKNPLNVSLNGKSQPDLNLSVSALIEDDFSNLSSADYANEPAILVKNVVYNFETVKQGVKVNAEYEIANTGAKPLLIRQVSADCQCIKIATPTSVVQPGETAMITVMLDTAKEEEGRGKFYPITLVTNAPAQSVNTLILTGAIEK